MSMNARCTACQKLFKVEASWVGKKVKCRGCGTIFVVQPETPAARAASSAAAPPPLPAMKPAVARTQPKPPTRPAPRTQSIESEADPFAGLEELAAIEATGTIHESPPIPRRTTAEDDDDFTDPGPPASVDPNYLSYGRAPVSPFVEIPGEESIDRFLPWVPVGIFAAFLVILASKGIAHLYEVIGTRTVPDDAKTLIIGKILGLVAGIAAAMSGVVAPLCLLGVFIASKLMQYETPSGLYLKCLAVMCTPVALAFAFNGFEIDFELSWVSMWICLPVMLGVLWLLVRLRAVPFLVTAALAAVFAVGVPMIILRAIFPTRTNFTGGRTTTVQAPPFLQPAGAGGAGRVPAGGGAQESIRLTLETNLRTVSQRMAAYVNEHQGKYPSLLDQLPGLPPEIFRPTDNRLRLSYLGALLKVPVPNDLMIAFSVSSVAGQKTVLYAGGRVETVSMDRWDQLYHEYIAYRQRPEP